MRKQTRILFALIMLSMVSSYAFSQQPSILLSGHTYSADRKEVGKLQLLGYPDAEFALAGIGKKFFKLRNNQLSIKARHLRSDNKWFDVEIKSKSDQELFQTFRIVKDEFIRNKVIAHRGAWKNTGASENSIAALQHAIRLVCEGSEFDVRMSADSVLVVNHDPDINSLKIDEVSGAELTRIKLGNGESLPTLEAYLSEGMRQNKTKLILEIKPTSSKERAIQMTRRVMNLVTQMKAQAWIDYISFDYTICKELLRLDPFARVAYLNGDKNPQELADDKLWGFDYHFNVLQKNEDWIPKAKEKGLTVNTWTVNDPDMMKWFLQRDVDFITTNEPEILLNLLNK